MKITFELPDNIKAISLTYVGVDEDDSIIVNASLHDVKGMNGKTIVVPAIADKDLYTKE